MIRSKDFIVEPVHPRDFVKMYGREFAIAVSGYCEDTLSKYTSRETSKRYIQPKEAVTMHFGLLHKFISESNVAAMPSRRSN